MEVRPTGRILSSCILVRPLDGLRSSAWEEVRSFSCTRGGLHGEFAQGRDFSANDSYVKESRNGGCFAHATRRDGVMRRMVVAAAIALFLEGMVMGDTAALIAAKKAKKDEFYTQRVDIENELRHYRVYFKGKVVLCNCDDPRQSEFFKYFVENFEKLGLKRLVATCYKSQDVDLFSQGDCERAICQIYEGDKNGNMTMDDDEIGVRELKGDGDFRSAECIEILKEADIVVTNPPFSLFREYVAQLVKYDKKFLIIGNVNALSYKEIFPLIKDNKMWLGASIHSGDRKFGVPDGYPLNAAGCGIDENGQRFIRVKGVRWFTNLDYSQRHEELPLYKHYTPEEFPKYDNYDAINVNKTSDIPCDYDGVIGVPITFIDKYSPEQFEIIGMAASAGYNKSIVGLEFAGIKDARPLISGKNTYARIFIRRKGK